MVIDETTRGLTLTRPWPFAFEKLNKRIENRSWPVPMLLRGVPIALHAGKGWSEGDKRFIERMGEGVLRGEEAHPHSVIFAVCVVYSCVYPSSLSISDDQKCWAFGPYLWIIEEYTQLVEPVACKGAQGLWTFDKRPVELDRLKAAYAEAITPESSKIKGPGSWLPEGTFV